MRQIQTEDGTTIGIISHIYTLEESIVCQIKVNKRAN